MRWASVGALAVFGAFLLYLTKWTTLPVPACRVDTVFIIRVQVDTVLVSLRAAEQLGIPFPERGKP